MAGLLLFAAASQAQTPSVYQVGAASRSINMDPDGTWEGEPVFTGSARTHMSIDGVGLNAHAVAIAASSNPADAMLIALIDDFGHFVSYKGDGDYGLVDIRRRVAALTGIDPQQILVQGSHSHQSPDTLGFWGGAPESYYHYIADQTVAAMVAAWGAVEPATLRVGEVHAPELQLNDYEGALGNEIVDRAVRVLQAARADGSIVATLSNLSTHGITANGSPTYHPDWPGFAAHVSAERFGGGGFGVVGTIGRVAPNREPSGDACAQRPPGQDKDVCRSAHYTNLFVDRAEEALANSTTLMGPPRVDGVSYLFTDVSTNPIPTALFYAPDATGLTMLRSTSPPWMIGNSVSTVATVVRVGDVAFVGMPGESFPSIFAVIEDLVPAVEHFAVGLANDMLGYIVHPFPEAYPEVIRRAGLAGDPNDPTTWEDGGDDKLLFNLSFTFGEQLTCNLLRGFGEIDGVGLDYWTTYGKCASFAGDLARPAGADTDPFPPTPPTSPTALPEPGIPAGALAGLLMLCGLRRCGRTHE